MKILFLHGWQSVPGGVKPTYLAQHGHEVINPKLPDEDFAEAVRIAQAEFDKHRPQAVVGSSRGGAVAMTISSGDARLVLLCPAWKKHGSARTVKPGTVRRSSRWRIGSRPASEDSRAEEVVRVMGSEEKVSGAAGAGRILMARPPGRGQAEAFQHLIHGPVECVCLSFSPRPAGERGRG